MNNVTLDMNGIGEDVGEDADGNIIFTKTVPIPDENILQIIGMKETQIRTNNIYSTQTVK